MAWDEMKEELEKSGRLPPFKLPSDLKQSVLKKNLRVRKRMYEDEILKQYAEQMESYKERSEKRLHMVRIGALMRWVSSSLFSSLAYYLRCLFYPHNL